jgi:hypothetical protein
MKKVLAVAVMAGILGMGAVAHASTLSWTFSFSKAALAEGGGTVADKGPVDEIKYTGEIATIFTPAGAPGVAGDTFVGYAVLRADQFFFLSGDVTSIFYGADKPADGITATHGLTAMLKYTGVQTSATVFTITSAVIEIIFDGPAGGYTYASDWSLASLSKFTDGIVVETGIGSGAGVTSGSIGDGASDLLLVLTDLLSSSTACPGGCGPFEIFSELGLSVALFTDNNNQTCDEQGGAAACTGEDWKVILDFGAAYWGDLIDTTGCAVPGAGGVALCEDGRYVVHTRADGSATKTQVPLPATGLLLGLGLLGLGLAGRRRG